VMFPFIQCHHTRGFALLGGVTKFLYKLSPARFAWEKEMTASSNWPKRERIFFIMACLVKSNDELQYNHHELSCQFNYFC